MKRILEDGRTLMASYDDINEFFQTNNIIGKEISDILLSEACYMAFDYEEDDDYPDNVADCFLEMDDPVCIAFTDGTNLEVEYCGDGPIILGYNTAKIKEYPKNKGIKFPFQNMFKYGIGKKITDIQFEKSDERMMFPEYRGINMSEDDDGIAEIRFVLDDDTALVANGFIDYFDFGHIKNSNRYVRITYRELLNGIN